ncbi:MAG: hypothetical protein QM526_02480 [Alphaproteobacteria bacterium]|nr:hypothetical protein [Alphaproteobacteria bacterium]
MAYTVTVKRKDNEPANDLFRRFTRKVRSLGATQYVKKNRYAKRLESKFTRKKSCLKRISKQKDYAFKFKMGKIQPTQTPLRRGR